MAKRINILPEWFDLKNYSSLSDMSDCVIFREVKCREKIANHKEMIKQNLNGISNPMLLLGPLGDLDQIMRGVVQVALKNKEMWEDIKQVREQEYEPTKEEIEEDAAKEKFKEFASPIDKSEPVHLMPVMDMIEVDDELLNIQKELNLSDAEELPFFESSFDLIKTDYLKRCNAEYEREHPEEIDDAINPLFEEILRTNLLLGFGKKLRVKVSIEGYSNEEILSHMAKMLPIWRSQLGLKNITRRSSRNDDIEKIIDYKIIPLMDLFNWEKIYDKKINRNFLLDYIYSNQDRGSSFLEGTVKPFITKILDPNYKLIEKN
jgi:hypothetical protein